MTEFTVVGVRKDTSGMITHYIVGYINKGLRLTEATVNETILALRRDANKINNLTLDSDNHTIRFAGVSEKKYVNFNDSKGEEYKHYTYVLAKETLNNKTIYHTFTVPDIYNKYEEAALISLSGYGKVSLVNAKIVNKKSKEYISAMKNTIPVLNQETKSQKEKKHRQVEDSRCVRADSKLKKKSCVDLVTPFNEKGEIAGCLDNELFEAYAKRIKERLRKRK